MANYVNFKCVNKCPIGTRWKNPYSKCLLKYWIAMSFTRRIADYTLFIYHKNDC